MRFPAPKHHFLKWVFFFFLLTFFVFSLPLALSDPRNNEAELFCGSSPSPSPSFVPDFVSEMDRLSKLVAENHWGTSQVSTIYGLSQCHQDLSATDCQLCFAASHDAIPRCIPAAAAHIFLDGCFLRYDSYSFYSEALNPAVDAVNCTSTVAGGSIVGEAERAGFNRSVGEVVGNVTRSAVAGGGFAVGEVGGVYALAQCWKTVSSDGCRDCLEKAGREVRGCAPASTEGRGLNAGCYLRYSTHKFYGHGQGSGDHGGSFGTGSIIAVVVAGAAFLMLSLFATYAAYARLTKTRADDGGGMDPEALRCCMSFGFSDKNSELSIGQYGNGFKTSSIRLGSDVILFTRRFKNRLLTQSIGLLSYTFLSLTGHNKIVVPMVHYEYNFSTGTFEPMHYHDKEYFHTNLSILLQWSPYSTESELLKQFDDIGHHGTKIIIYNLWLNDQGDTELDFDADSEDIRINCDPTHQMKGLSNQHIAIRYQYSLRVYSSILYLRLPDCFKVILRGRVVDCYRITSDLKYPEFIVYRPQTNGQMEATVITTIGFVKEAPRVATHGFNIYHRNRLILPFWPAVKDRTGSAGKGVVGVLQADFIQPTHSKQDFEKTSLFERLEDRLKQMTTEYWDLHCELIGYQPKKRKRAASLPCLESLQSRSRCHEPPYSLNKASPISVSLGDPLVSNASAQCPGEPVDDSQVMSQQGLKRKNHHLPEDLENARHIGSEACATETLCNLKEKLGRGIEDQQQDLEKENLMKENKRLKSRLLEMEKRREHLKNKVQQLSCELKGARGEYNKLLVMAELGMTN